MIEREYLMAAGAALHGERYQAALAADLGMSRQHLARILSGERPALPEHVAKARKLLDARATEIRALLAA